MFATLQIVRGQDGRIRQITKTLTASTNLSLAAISVTSLAAGGYLIVTVRSFRDVGHAFIGVLLVAAGIILSATVLRRFRQAKANTSTLADQWGISLPCYRELGVIPWSAISGFRLVAAGYFTGLGDQALVADLIEPERFIRRLSADNALAPGRFRAPPFALVERARSVDVASLKVALDELRNQGLPG